MATLKEQKEQILIAIYNLYKSGGSVSIMAKALCEANNIVYNSRSELETALRSLVNSNYIKVAFVTGSNVGLISDITPEGVEYVEDYLLSEDGHIVDALKNADRLTKSGATDDSASTVDVTPKIITNFSDDDIQTLYKATANYKNIADLETEACFGVNALVDCFIKQMDKIASHGNENFCMLGIFGPWGRGKTYFFKKIKEKLSGRNDNSKYKIVEFNAWKYQDTPAIWAYLYEKLYAQTDWWQKVRLWWNRLLSSLPSLGNIAIFLLVVLTAWILYFFMYKCLIKAPNIQKILQEIQIPIIWISLVLGTIYNFIKNPVPTYKYIIKHSQRKNYKSYLGIQNDLENDLEVLLTKMITKPQEEQLLLYVDDIDRCSTDKMLEVINSLRIILENPEIQKRLIVICSIDPDKLISGYCLQKAGRTNDQNLIEEAREHIDKLFIFGIGLAPIKNHQYGEYLQKLTGLQHDPTVYTIKLNLKKNDVKNNNDSHPNTKINELTDEEIYLHITSFLDKQQDKTLTPRKLRIMYYRLLFANNLIANGNGEVPASIMDEILMKSIDCKHNTDNSAIYADIINTVVPY
ncbi:P-loop NTPase fold protein [Alistipes dispar]|uniref:P-loop NTPase fold protein n=1 Tax=Alistipes dispar TaxID=2585119 RepID=UPI003BF211CC